MNKKKAAAALAAVSAVIKTQEEAAAMMAMPDTAESKDTGVAAKPARPLNIWGLSGRQQQMLFRANMQLRIY